MIFRSPSRFVRSIQLLPALLLVAALSASSAFAQNARIIQMSSITNYLGTIDPADPSVAPPRPTPVVPAPAAVAQPAGTAGAVEPAATAGAVGADGLLLAA